MCYSNQPTLSISRDVGQHTALIVQTSTVENEVVLLVGVMAVGSHLVTLLPLLEFFSSLTSNRFLFLIPNLFFSWPNPSVSIVSFRN